MMPFVQMVPGNMNSAYSVTIRRFSLIRLVARECIIKDVMWSSYRFRATYDERNSLIESPVEDGCPEFYMQWATRPCRAQFLGQFPRTHGVGTSKANTVIVISRLESSAWAN